MSCCDRWRSFQNRLIQTLFVLGMFVGMSVCWPSFTAAQQNRYTLEFIYPQVGQRGTTVEVTAVGSFLNDPKEVLFYQPGIECLKIEECDETINYQNGKTKSAAAGQAAKLILKIDPDAGVGEYQLRIRTADNLSELVTFWVTPFPVIAEQNAFVDSTENGKPLRNDSPEFAQEITLNSTVSGYISKMATQDHDWYRVQCKAGDCLTAEVIAAKLGFLHYGGMNDPAIEIFNTSGKRLARNDDNALHTQDPYISTIIPEDGKYLIHIYQQMDYETSLRHYHLHVGTFPRPTVLYPLGGKLGQRVSLDLLGVAGEKTNLERLLPKTTGIFEKAYLPIETVGKNQHASICPNRIHMSPFGSINEVAGDHRLENPQLIQRSLPLNINGKISAEGEIDWYQFSAKKGERFRVRTFAKTLDSELDAKVWIRPAKGNPSSKVYEFDDTRWDEHDLVGHHYRWQCKDRLDPIFVFEPNRDGEWLIGIGDTRREYGKHHIYRIEFQPHVDSTFIHFPAYPSSPTIVRDRIVVYPGKYLTRPLAIQKGLGCQYKKALQLRPVGLPKGVTLSTPSFSASDTLIPMTVYAQENVESFAAAINVIVEPVDPLDRESFQGGFVQVLPATNRRGDFAMHFDRTRKMSVAVCSGAPFDIQMEPIASPLVKNGELDLVVHVKRENSFEGAIYCEMDWLPPGISKQPPLIIPANQSKATYRLRAQANAKTGTFPISITARENQGGNVRTGAGFHYVCSKPIDLNVGEPYVRVDLQRMAIERGTEGELIANIEYLKPFQGKATLELGGLPFGMVQLKPFPKIQTGDKQVSFKVKATKDCLTGLNKGIFCEISLYDNGQLIRQRSGDATVRVDEERK